MAAADQIEAVRQFGYSPMEAQFIADAALHSGFFLRRQYSKNRGKRNDDLCKKLIARDHVAVYSFAHRTRLYHLCAKPLYAALGQDENRHRRARDPFAIRAKVMGLDYVLLNPGYRYLPTEQEKVEFFESEASVNRVVFPTKMYTGKDESSHTERYFVDKFPIRVDGAGEVAFAYIDDGVSCGPSFHTWLGQYRNLIAALPSAEVVYVAPTPTRFTDGARKFSAFFPHATGALPPELMGYFSQRQAYEARNFTGLSQTELDAFKSLKRLYSEARFESLYNDWRRNADMPKEESKVRFSTFLLPFEYRMFGNAGVPK